MYAIYLHANNKYIFCFQNPVLKFCQSGKYQEASYQTLRIKCCLLITASSTQPQ